MPSSSSSLSSSHAYSRLRTADSTKREDVNVLTVNSTDIDPVSLVIPRLPNETDEEYAARKVSRRRESLIHSATWVILACIIIYYSQLYTVIIEDTRIHWFPLYVAILSSCIIGAILIYLSYIVPRQLKVSFIVDYESAAPRSIYSLIVLGTINYFCSIIALWPVYDFSAILIVSIVGLAIIMTPNLFPSSTKQKY